MTRTAACRQQVERARRGHADQRPAGESRGARPRAAACRPRSGGDAGEAGHADERAEPWLVVVLTVVVASIALVGVVTVVVPGGVVVVEALVLVEAVAVLVEVVVVVRTVLGV